MEKEELRLALNLVDAMNQISGAPNVWYSPYFAHIKRDITSRFWNDIIVQTCLSVGKQAVELTQGLSPDDPRMTEFSQIVEQVMQGYSEKAQASGYSPVICGIPVWDPSSLTPENLERMDSRLKDLVA